MMHLLTSVRNTFSLFNEVYHVNSYMNVSSKLIEINADVTNKTEKILGLLMTDCEGLMNSDTIYASSAQRTI